MEMLVGILLDLSSKICRQEEFGIKNISRIFSIKTLCVSYALSKRGKEKGDI